MTIYSVVLIFNYIGVVYIWSVKAIQFFVNVNLQIIRFKNMRLYYFHHHYICLYGLMVNLLPCQLHTCTLLSTVFNLRQPCEIGRTSKSNC